MPTLAMPALKERSLKAPRPSLSIRAIPSRLGITLGGAVKLDLSNVDRAGLFFEDRAQRLIQDSVFTRLHTFPNVVIRGHQAFFTREALANITAFETGHGDLHAVLDRK